MSQNVNKDALQEENKQLVPGNEQTMPDVPEKRYNYLIFAFAYLSLIHFLLWYLGSVICFAV